MNEKQVKIDTMSDKNAPKDDLKQKNTPDAPTSRNGAEKAPEGLSGATGPEADKTPLFRPLEQYVQDLSFECPRAPMLTPEGERNMDLNVSVGTHVLSAERGLHVVTLGVQAKGEDTAKTPIFLAEVAYSGVFEAQNLAPNQLEAALMVDAPALLFPFARQIVMNSLANSGFRPPLLEPINFAALYVQNKKDK